MKSLHFILPLVSIPIGCGPSAWELKEKTLSTLNVEADRWDGGAEFTTAASDAYGRAISATVEKRLLNHHLELRSSGPDGLPKNSDDIVVSRSKTHGETTLTREASKAAEAVSRGSVKGIIQGTKEGLGLGKGREPRAGR